MDYTLHQLNLNLVRWLSIKYYLNHISHISMNQNIDLGESLYDLYGYKCII